jgi:hypothetical protein
MVRYFWTREWSYPKEYVKMAEKVGKKKNYARTTLFDRRQSDGSNWKS